MDLRQLEILQAIAETGSFTACGRKLHVSQSAICRLMADWDTCSFLPHAVNEPVSAMACRISSCRRSIRFPETHPVGFGSEERHGCHAEHHRHGNPGHR